MGGENPIPRQPGDVAADPIRAWLSPMENQVPP